MSDDSRSLPDRPNLRFLKLEARRRLAAGEFDTLHNAQLAIAREHGLSSWTVLKETISSQAQADDPADDPALAQVRWLVSRFGGADGPDWEPPGDTELREHFVEQFLAMVKPWKLVATMGGRAAELRQDLAVVSQEPLTVRARVGGIEIDASAEADSPHRLNGLRAYPVGVLVKDPRVARPPAGSSHGDVPATVSQIADEALPEVGLAGLVIGGGTGDAAWATARGWANLDKPEVLRPDHRLPAPGVTKLITAVGMLRLAVLAWTTRPTTTCAPSAWPTTRSPSATC
jgi:hypothetical protein